MPRRPSGEVTLRDVALAAGVSVATASRVLGVPTSASHARREQVVRAARELGYRPAGGTRAVGDAGAGRLALVVPDLADLRFAAIARGVLGRARETGRTVLAYDAGGDATVEADILRSLPSPIDGVVLCGSSLPAGLLEDCSHGRRLVLVDGQVGSFPAIVFDVGSGIGQALAHLRALGHAVIAYVGGSPADSWYDHAQRGALSAAGIEVIHLGHVPPTHGGGVAAADLVLDSGATAVLCHNDAVAIGVVRRLEAHGRRVPEDMSVVGFGNDPASALVRPELTTVALPLLRAGREAADLAEPPALRPGPGPLPTELVVRGSTARARRVGLRVAP